MDITTTHNYGKQYLAELVEVHFSQKSFVIKKNSLRQTQTDNLIINCDFKKLQNLISKSHHKTI
jgi:hypothetical protein